LCPSPPHWAKRTEAAVVPSERFTARLPRGRLGTIVTMLRVLIHAVRNPYRPELHYMRGPGPRWLAKNGTLA
jgi:hypothetical protein